MSVSEGRAADYRQELQICLPVPYENPEPLWEGAPAVRDGCGILLVYGNISGGSVGVIRLTA